MDVLRTGLQRLPNLKQISVLDRFCAWLDFAPFLWAANEFQWYLDWLGEFRPSIANPSTWSDANCGLEGTALDDAPWDLRGITNLLAAVEEDAPHLRDFYLGCQASKLSADIYFREENVRSLCKIAPRLTSFKMELDMPGFDPDLPPIDHFQKVEDILQKMLSLSSLSFAFHRAPGDAFEVFWNLKLPHLTMLDLGDGYWELDNVETLVKAHVDTLRELRLRNMCIMEGGSWENVATNLGQSLQLHMVSLMSLADKTRESVYLDDDDVQETARLFMQRTPDHLFGVHVSTGAAIAWHKQTFKPTYDFDSVLAQTP